MAALEAIFMGQLVNKIRVVNLRTPKFFTEADAEAEVRILAEVTQLRRRWSVCCVCCSCFACLEYRT